MTQKLLDGFKRFCEEHYSGDDALMPRLAEQGQNPEYFIISCMDSRTLPGIIFKQPPGTFFPFTPMGAIVRPYKKGTALSAGLKYALEIKNVRQIVVLGHTGCGAIEALISNSDDEEIGSFVEVAQEGLARARALCGDQCTDDKLHRLTEEQIVLLSAENLKTYPSVAKGLKNGTLEIFQWVFDMQGGALKAYNPASEEFEPIPGTTYAAKKGACCAHGVVN